MAYNLEQLSVKLARENAASDVKIWGGHHMGAGAQVSAGWTPKPVYRSHVLALGFILGTLLTVHLKGGFLAHHLSALFLHWQGLGPLMFLKL